MPAKPNLTPLLHATFSIFLIGSVSLNAQQRMAGGPGHSLFVNADGSLWGVGANDFGQLGDGSRGTRSSPVKIADEVASVTTSSQHALFVKTDGSLWAMGSNEHGVFGNGSTAGTRSPIKVADELIDGNRYSSHQQHIPSMTRLLSRHTLWRWSESAN